MNSNVRYIFDSLESHNVEFVTSAFVAEVINLPAIEKSHKNNLHTQRFSDALYIEFVSGEVWCFSYGMIVIWSLDEKFYEPLLDALTPYFIAPFENVLWNQNTLNAHQLSSQMNRLRDSKQNDHKLIRLSESRAIAQLNRIKAFSEATRTTLETHDALYRYLVTYKICHLPARQIKKIVSEVFQCKSYGAYLLEVTKSGQPSQQDALHAQAFNSTGHQIRLPEHLDRLKRDLNTLDDMHFALKKYLNYTSYRLNIRLLMAGIFMSLIAVHLSYVL